MSKSFIYIFLHFVTGLNYQSPLTFLVKNQMSTQEKWNKILLIMIVYNGEIYKLVVFVLSVWFQHF